MKIDEQNILNFFKNIKKLILISFNAFINKAFFYINNARKIYIDKKITIKIPQSISNKLYQLINFLKEKILEKKQSNLLKINFYFLKRYFYLIFFSSLISIIIITTFFTNKNNKDIIFEKNILWSTKQAVSGKCSDIVRQSNLTFAEGFRGFNPDSAIFYFAFTDNTSPIFRNNPDQKMNKHLKFSAEYSFDKEFFLVTTNNGNNSTIEKYLIDKEKSILTRVDIQCLKNTKDCNDAIASEKMAIEYQKKQNSFKSYYACTDDLPERDMFSGSPIERLKKSTGDPFYEAFACLVNFSEETEGLELAKKLIKYLKNNNLDVYNDQITRSKKLFNSIEVYGHKIDSGCSKIELTRSKRPNENRIFIDKDDKLDFVLYKTQGLGGFGFMGYVERR